MPTPAELLSQSIAKGLTANRIDGNKNSYRRDNPTEYTAVVAYLTGGARPSNVVSDMGMHLVLEEDARRALAAGPTGATGATGVTGPGPTGTTGATGPTGDQLRWAAPALNNPVQITLTNANRNGALANGQGRDARVSVAEVLTGGVGQVSGWRNLVWIGGEFQTSGNPTSSGHVIPINNTGTLHFEGIKAKVSGDFFGARFTNPVIQIQGCDIQVSDEGGSAHADAFQTQYLTCDELRVDRCTIRTDYQGFFVSNEPKLPEQPLPSQVKRFLLSRTNFRPGPMGYPATFVFKAIPSKTSLALGPWVLDDVWIPDDNPTHRVYPSSSGTDWAGNPLATRCSRVGNTIVWTADAGITGVINIGTPPDFAVGAGMGYVSPG